MSLNVYKIYYKMLLIESDSISQFFFILARTHSLSYSTYRPKPGRTETELKPDRITSFMRSGYPKNIILLKRFSIKVIVD